MLCAVRHCACEYCATVSTLSLELSGLMSVGTLQLRSGSGSKYKHCRRSVLFLTRSTAHRTREDVVLPLSEPVRGRDGQMISEIPLPKDTMVLVGVLSSNTSKALWGEDAYEWKPERWLSPLPETVTEAKIPGVYSNLFVLATCLSAIHDSHVAHRMTFWGGGRACM